MTSDSAAAQPLQVARQLLRERKVADASKLLQTFMEQNVENREGQELLGMALFMSKQFEEAKAAFEQLTRMDPTNATAWANLGAVQNTLGDHHGATKSLRKAIHRDKKSASGYYNLAIAQKALKMNSMAVSAYKEAIKLDPKMAEAYTNLGNMYIEMNNLTQAIKLLENGIEQCPQSRKVAAVLEKARVAKSGSRRIDAPLGRLVNEEELAKQQIRTTRRGLSSAVRIHERETLQDLGKKIRRSTRPLLELASSRLHQQLHVMDLAVAQKDARGEAPAKFEELVATIDEMDRLRSVAVTAISEIKTHLEKTDPGI